MSTMDLSSLNIDVLLQLMKFLDPVDQFNLVLSGTIKGFESVHEGIDLRERIEEFGIELGLRRDSTCELEIRSLKNNPACYYKQIPESLLIILNRLADGGFLKNNRQWIVSVGWSRDPWLFQVIRSMSNLETLNLLKCKLTLTDLRQLFRSCPKLTELRLMLFDRQNLEMNVSLKNVLRPGFQRLRLLEIELEIDLCLVIQEILMWLKECAQLIVRDVGWWPFPMDVYFYLTLSPDLSPNLRVLCLVELPVEFVKWILSFCPNIETLKLHLNEEPYDLHSDIVRLKKLKDLHIGSSKEIDLKKIIRNCRQVEILRVNAYGMKLRDLADLKHYTNLKQAHLLWSDGFSPKSQREDKSETEKFLTGRLTLARKTLPSMTLKEICDFIMKLKHLTYLHIKYHYDLQCDHIKSLVDEVKAFFLPRRPNFNFYVSCCEQFELMEHVKLNCT